DQHRPPIVLQPGGYKLRFPRRPPIDQRNDRQPLSNIAGSSADPLEAARFAALDDNDVAFVDKGIGYRDSRLKSATGIVSQIEDKADHLVAGPLPQILHRAGQRRRGCAVAAGEPSWGAITFNCPFSIVTTRPRLTWSSLAGVCIARYAASLM